MTEMYHTGRVKWFNNRNGYGFITTSDNNDIFVHHSSIQVANEQYKYLVEGEYVTFELKNVDSSKYENEAFNVRGIGRGLLMCETRNNQRNQRRTRGQNRSQSNENAAMDME